jgi:lipid-A-disaccharide synthase-like uncharacterized protein
MRYLKLILAVFWTAFIVFALIKEPGEIPQFKWLAVNGIDKVIHGIMFFAEAWLITWNLRIKIDYRAALLIVLFCTVFGGVLEVVQFLYIVGRSGDAIDLLADAFGAILGVLVFQKWNNKMK